MKNHNTSYTGLRPDLLKFIEGRPNKFLDLGCATGENGKYLKQHFPDAEIIGVEYDDDMSVEARKIYDNFFNGDLNSDEFLKKLNLNLKDVDYVICGDILEHLKNPEIVIELCKSILNSSGRILISVPNIQHLELFIQVYLKGTFPRNKRGIFDKTHLRWFTYKDITKLIEEKNLKIIHYEAKFRSRDALNSKFTLFYKIMKLVNPKLVTFQHLIVVGN